MNSEKAIMVTPAAEIVGYRVVKTIGLVRGNTIRARNIGRDITAALKNLVGGEIEEYTKLMGEAREQAIARMIEHAKSVGANAVTDMKFMTSMVMGGASEILAYGNAVIVEAKSSPEGSES